MQDAVPKSRSQRKSFRFGLRTLFALTLVCCFAVLAMKWRNDAIIAKKKSWMLNNSAGNAVLVEDGDVIMVRNGQSCGAIVVKSQTIDPERLEYDWYYRSDGSGMVFADHPAVTNGSASLGSPTSEINMHIGPFDLQWSGGDRGLGYFYYPHDPSVEFCVVRVRQRLDIDVMADGWQFESRKDMPTLKVSPAHLELLEEEAKNLAKEALSRTPELDGVQAHPEISR